MGRPGPELVSGFGRTHLAILGAAADKELLPGPLAFGRAGDRPGLTHQSPKSSVVCFISRAARLLWG